MFEDSKTLKLKLKLKLARLNLPYDWRIEQGNRGAVPGNRSKFADALDEERAAFWMECKLEVLRMAVRVHRRHQIAQRKINFLVNRDRAEKMLRSMRRVTVMTQFFKPIGRSEDPRQADAGQE